MGAASGWVAEEGSLVLSGLNVVNDSGEELLRM